MERKARVLWVDVAKGICMLFVVIAHMSGKALNPIMSPHGITVFFILSGYMLKNDLCRETLGKKFRRLMLPYFITCAAVTGMDVVNKIITDTADAGVITQTVGMDLVWSFFASGDIKKYGTLDLGGQIGAIWFLPALYFGILATQCLLKYVTDKRSQYVAAVSLALFAHISSRQIWYPFSIQAALMAVPVILLGYDFRQNGALERISRKELLVCAAVYAASAATKLSMVFFVSASVEDLIVSSLCAVASSICVIYLSQKLQKSKVLGWIGRNSIFFLCIHLFEMKTMGRWFQKAVEGIGLPFTPPVRFVTKLLFISAGTAVILAIRKRCARKAKPLPAAVHKVRREPVVDLAKSVLVVPLLLDTFPLDPGFRKILCGFCVAALVFYSGYCFREDTEQPLVIRIRDDALRYLLPYACFGLGYLLLTHDGNAMELKRLLYGLSGAQKLFAEVGTVGPVYVILLLFLTKLMYLLIHRFFREEYCKALAVLVISLLGMYLGRWGYWLPWSADCAMYVLTFYYLGYLFRKYRIMEYITERNYLYFVLSCFWAYMIQSGSINIAARGYCRYGVAVLGAASGAVLVYMMCGYLYKAWSSRITAAICLIGRNAVPIIIAHTLLHRPLSLIVMLTLTEGSVFYITAMIAVPLAVGIAAGSAVTHLKRLR